MCPPNSPPPSPAAAACGDRFNNHGSDAPPAHMASQTDAPSRAASNSHCDNKARKKRSISTSTKRPAAHDARSVVLLKLRRGCLIMACIACCMQAFFEFVIDDRPTVTTVPDGGPPPIKTLTLAVGQQIGSILDLYSPLLSTTSPLLGQHCAARASCDLVPAEFVGKAPDGDLAGPYVGLGETDADVEGWVFPLLRREVWVVCTMRSQCGLGPVVSFSDVCKGLLRSLWRAEEKHYEIADSLAGPRRDGLWVSKIAFSFLDFLGRLEAAAAHPRFAFDRDSGGNMLRGPSPDEAAAGELDTRSARALMLLVAERGPWQSVNSIIRHDLLSLRASCAQIVEELELLSQACRPQGESGYTLAFTATMTRASGFIPCVKHIILAIDDGIAALDAVEGRMTALRTVLDRLTNASWTFEEHIDGEDWVVIVRLPPPWDISRSVGERLERMGADASGLYEAKAPLEHLPMPAGRVLDESI